MRMVLGSGTDHGRPADIDLGDAALNVRAGGHGLLERVEIDHEEVYRRDAMLFHRGRVILPVTPGEQPAMYARVQGFNPPVHHFRIAGDVGRIARLQPGSAQSGQRATGGDQLHAHLRQLAGAGHQARLVRYRDQRPAHRRKEFIRHEGNAP